MNKVGERSWGVFVIGIKGMVQVERKRAGRAIIEV